MTGLVMFPVAWPSSALSTNAKSPWGRKSQIARTAATKKARAEAFYSAKKAGIDNLLRSARYQVLVEFYPPDRRHRDAHNFPALVKAHLDGLQDALGCDDNRFDVTFKAHAFDGKGGVLISVRGTA